MGRFEGTSTSVKGTASAAPSHLLSVSSRSPERSSNVDVDRWVINLATPTIKEVSELELQIGRLAERLNLRLAIPGGVRRLSDLATFFKQKGLLHAALAAQRGKHE